jgi:predicted metal-binding protein
MLKTENLETKKEIFICQFGKDCSQKESALIADDLKKWSKELIDQKIKVTRTGCLGKCSEGVALLCYPEKKFLLNVTLNDLEQIKKGLS